MKTFTPLLFGAALAISPVPASAQDCCYSTPVVVSGGYTGCYARVKYRWVHPRRTVVVSPAVPAVSVVPVVPAATVTAAPACPPPAYPETRHYYHSDRVYADTLEASVQRELARLGYYQGAIDGVIGPMTQSAIAAFQSDDGLVVTGRIDSVLLRALRID